VQIPGPLRSERVADGTQYDDTWEDFPEECALDNLRRAVNLEDG
jgi:hypothetical protein